MTICIENQLSKKCCTYLRIDSHEISTVFQGLRLMVSLHNSDCLQISNKRKRSVYHVEKYIIHITEKFASYKNL
jgi:hypothetical protein